MEDFEEKKYSGLIVAVTDSGHSARMISKYRPNRTILAVTPNQKTAREMAIVWGVVPEFSLKISTDFLEKRVIGAVRTGITEGYLSKDDHVVVVSSSMVVGDDGIFAGVYDVSSLID